MKVIRVFVVVFIIMTSLERLYLLPLLLERTHFGVSVGCATYSVSQGIILLERLDTGPTNPRPVKKICSFTARNGVQTYRLSIPIPGF